MPDDPMVKVRGQARGVYDELLTVRAELRDVERRVDILLDGVGKILKGGP